MPSCRRAPGAGFVAPVIRLAVAVAVLGSVASVQAETIEGLLEHGKPYSAIFSLSPESGDLIGHVFRNDSAVGKAVLTHCLPNMFCQVPGAVTRPVPGRGELFKFSEAPSGWLEITRAQPAELVSGVSEHARQVKTRFGTLKVADDLTLWFKGKPVTPTVQGNAGLSIVDVQEVGKQDVAVIQSTGGTGCPALFRFVAVSAQAVQVSPEVGSCSDVIRVSRSGQAVLLHMPDAQQDVQRIYRWQMTPQHARESAPHQAQVTEQRLRVGKP